MRQGLVMAAVALALVLTSAGSAAAQGRVRGAYLDIVYNYYDGNFQQAIDEIAAWPLDSLSDRAFTDLDEGVITGQGLKSMTAMSEGQRFNTVKMWSTLAPVAALLHIETGHQLLQKGQDKASIAHLMLARAMVDWPRWRFIRTYLPSQQEEAAYKQLRRDAYLTIAWLLQSAAARQTLNEHLALARERLPEEAEVWLASGSAEELYAERSMVRTMDRPDRRVPRDVWEQMTQQRLLAKAEEFHREATVRDPALAEAHVRLGRVRQLRGKLPEARAALETARTLEAPSEVSYLATLFLAGVIEESHRHVPAFELYAELVERWPECQSGHLGMSRAFEVRGNRQAALDALKPLSKEPDRRACFDVFWVYRSGQAWRLKTTLAALRERVVS